MSGRQRTARAEKGVSMRDVSWTGGEHRSSGAHAQLSVSAQDLWVHYTLPITSTDHCASPGSHPHKHTCQLLRNSPQRALPASPPLPAGQCSRCSTRRPRRQPRQQTAGVLRSSPPGAQSRGQPPPRSWSSCQWQREHRCTSQSCRHLQQLTRASQQWGHMCVWHVGGRSVLLRTRRYLLGTAWLKPPHTQGKSGWLRPARQAGAHLLLQAKLSASINAPSSAASASPVTLATKHYLLHRPWVLVGF